MNFIYTVFHEALKLLLESSPYILFGILISGLFRVYLNPQIVARHMGRGRFLPVVKASFLGIPIPLCSCGVLPAAVTLNKQGANKGATTAFLISTPESGVDSIAITYALIDPIMTVARPVAAFITATFAGILENLAGKSGASEVQIPDISCPVDGCCPGTDCPPEVHKTHHTFMEKLKAGLRFARTEVWGDIAVWFFIGLILAGLITALFPADLMAEYLGGGIQSMLIMLVIGIPLYICASASTPIAAALILKGVSPGAALVFLMAGPATNITSLTVMTGTFGKRTTIIYLSTVMVFSLLFGLILDGIYNISGFSAQAIVGQAGEIFPPAVQWVFAIILLIMSVRPVFSAVKRVFTGGHEHGEGEDHDHEHRGEKTETASVASCSGST